MTMVPTSTAAVSRPVAARTVSPLTPQADARAPIPSAPDTSVSTICSAVKLQLDRDGVA